MKASYTSPQFRMNSTDSVDFQEFIVFTMSSDSLEPTERFEISELLEMTSLDKDSARKIMVSIDASSPRISFGDGHSFYLDNDSAKMTLSGIFSERLSGSDLSGLRVKVLESGMDSNLHATFITEPGRLGNVFFASGDFMAAVDITPGVILKRMIPEIIFALLLFTAIAGAFFFINRSLEKERKLALLKDDFVSNMTHELKTPISIVNVAVEALSDFKGLDDKKRTKEYLNISKHELSRLDGMVDKILGTTNANATHKSPSVPSIK